jgi:hypothetical protein
MMDQNEVRIYGSNRYWHCWRTISLLKHSGRSLDVLGTSDDADPGAWLAHFMEEDRR